MRLRPWTGGAGETFLAPGGAEVGDRPALLGGWSATRWHYTSRVAPERAVDVVCDLRRSVTLSLSPESYILAWDTAGGERQSIGGGFRVVGGALEFAGGPGGDGPTRVDFRLGPCELALSCDDSGWDFDGQGEETPARLVAVFVRL